MENDLFCEFYVISVGHIPNITRMYVKYTTVCMGRRLHLIRVRIRNVGRIMVLCVCLCVCLCICVLRNSRSMAQVLTNIVVVTYIGKRKLS